MTNLSKDILLIKESGLFDEEWYLNEYRDVAILQLDAVAHYVSLGEKLGRNPSPVFNVGRYSSEYRDVSNAKISPLVHYIQYGKKEGRKTFPVGVETLTHAHDGDISGKSASPTVLLCAHTAGTHLFGGERSFLDLLKGFFGVGFNIIVAVPYGSHPEYINQLKKHSIRIYSIDYRWWQDKNAPCDKAIEQMLSIIEREGVDAVHSNTIMLREPILAAKKAKIPGVVHVRELIEHDADLCSYIANTPENIIQSVLELSDYVIANSNLTARSFYKSGCTFIAKNVIDVDLFSKPRIPSEAVVRVGLVSSNIPKKGIYDLVEVARLIHFINTNVEFVLFGPHNNYITELISDQKEGNVPHNVSFEKYGDDPSEIMRNIDILVNFSSFQESFGRTVLEAMAASIPVVAYDWGALSELVVDGVTGFLVPFKDVKVAAEKIEVLCRDSDLRKKFGLTGQHLAKCNYSILSLQNALSSAYSKILKRVEDKKISVIIPNYNYEVFLEERITSIINQTLSPSEIIFLDDNSTDGSLKLAEELLSQQDIPYKIVKNKTNMGTYHQWLKGIYSSNYEYIWIAEADDSSDINFLSNLLSSAQNNDGVNIYYSQSRVIDENGEILKEANLYHTNDLSVDHWCSSFVEEGCVEIENHLMYRNTIPNVSACVFKTDELKRVAFELSKYRYCGDWYLYCRLLESGKVSYNKESLNYFRRHGKSVTRTNSKSSDYMNEILSIQNYIFNTFSFGYKHLKKLEVFFNRDYKFSDVSVNSKTPAFISLENSIRSMENEKLRITFITTNNGSHNGGSEVLWREAALKIREKKCEVQVAIKDWNPAPQFIEEFRALGIDVIHKNNEEFGKVKKFNPNLVVLSLGDQDEGTDWYEYLFANNIPYVVVNQLTKNISVWPINKNKNPKVRDGYQRAEKVFFTCIDNIRIMEERLACSLNNSGVHYNPFHMDRNIRIPFPSMSEGLKIAIPARLLKIHKGQHLALELFNQQKWRDRDVLLTLYGDGPDEAEFKSFVQINEIKNVRFVNRIPDIKVIWQENHAILLTSFMEGLPIVLVGAMISGRVPVVTEVGGHAEVLEDGISGFLAREITVASIDDALERAYAVRHKWEEIGENARNNILRIIPVDPVCDFISKLPIKINLDA